MAASCNTIACCLMKNGWVEPLSISACYVSARGVARSNLCRASSFVPMWNCVLLMFLRYSRWHWYRVWRNGWPRSKRFCSRWQSTNPIPIRWLCGGIGGHWKSISLSISPTCVAITETTMWRSVESSIYWGRSMPTTVPMSGRYWLSGLLRPRVLSAGIPVWQVLAPRSWRSM